MRRITGAILLALAPMAQAIEYREELAPPNVDFYLELLGARTDFGNFAGDQENGLRIRLGFDLKDATIGRWMWRAEIGLNQFGESEEKTSTFVDPTDQINDQLIIDRTMLYRVTGIELGARLYDNELFFLRGGAFIYNLKTRSEETKTEADINGIPTGTPPNVLTPNEASDSSVGPYLGAGFEFPLVESAKLVTEFDIYRVEGEYLKNINLGFRFEF